MYIVQKKMFTAIMYEYLSIVSILSHKNEREVVVKFDLVESATPEYLLGKVAHQITIPLYMAAE